jgi:hypothetical protein
MKTALLLAALLFASSSESFALSATKGVHSFWQMCPRVLATKRILVTVVAVPDPTHVVVHVESKGELLLIAYEPMRERFGYASVKGLEVTLLLSEVTGQQSLGFALVPPIGYKWRTPHCHSARFFSTLKRPKLISCCGCAVKKLPLVLDDDCNETGGWEKPVYWL